MVLKDATPQWSSTTNSSTDSTRLTSSQLGDDSLQSFFKRPIIIYQTAWTPSNVTPLTASISPWSLFFQNPRVANRMTNYNLLSCKLRVRVLLNGNTFYFGRLLLDYVPLPSVDQVTELSPATLAVPAYAVPASQRLHLYLDPTTSMGGELELPFIWPYDTLSIPGGSLSSMGVLLLRELVQLKHSNASVTPVEITMMAWAEDVELSVPTTINTAGLVAQGEYSISPVSNMASAIANVAGRLTTVPVIGPYARATEMMSTTLGGIARMFGFSRPPILEDFAPMRPSYFGNVTNTDTGDTVTKLTVDSKQELSVDPRLFGADTGDELVLHRLASIESYLTQFAWTVARPPDAHLWSVRVGPVACIQTSNTYYMPACAFTALPFSNWRGTLRYRFQIVASGFHKGRLKVMWDPSYIATTETNVAFTRIIDLATEREFTIDVAWGQPRAYQLVGLLSNGAAQYSTTAFASADTLRCNGVLGVYVLNTLTTPNSTVNNDISIMVSMSMCEDAEFAAPVEAEPAFLATQYNYTVQGDVSEVPADEGAPEATDPPMCIIECNQENARPLVYFGERIVSFRQLLRRYNFHSVYLNGSPTAPNTGDAVWSLTLPDFPQYRGYSTKNMHVTSTAGKYNYVNATLLTYLTPAFLGVRGGLRSKYKIRCSDPGNVVSLNVNRTPGSTYSTVATAINTAGVSKYAQSIMEKQPMLHAGGAVTAPERQPVLEVEFPYYKGYRFDYARESVTGSNLYPGGIGNSHHTLTATVSGTSIKSLERYVSVGEDFQLFHWLGAPAMRSLATPTPG